MTRPYPSLEEQDAERRKAEELLPRAIDNDRRAPCPRCSKRLRPYVATTWPYGPWFRQHEPCGPSVMLEEADDDLA